MNPSYLTQVESPEPKVEQALAERMDPAIGEATSVMGAVLTELLRRTLRGGVMQIGGELHGFVSEKVDATLAERTPAIEQAAVEVAGKAARTAATEVVVEEVHALERRTQEADRDLAGKVEAGARELAAKIQDAERRVAETTQAEMHEFMARAKEGTAVFKARLSALEITAAELGKVSEKLRQDLARQLDEHRDGLHAEVEELRRHNGELAARLAELERPRGLRALTARLFGRGKEAGGAEPEANLSGPA